MILNFLFQGKKIDKVSCGSAHTIAWSTSQSTTRSSVPKIVPIEFNHLQNLPLSSLRNRAFLLHSFSKLFCSCIPLMSHDRFDYSVDTLQSPGIHEIKNLILLSFKVCHPFHSRNLFYLFNPTIGSLSICSKPQRLFLVRQSCTFSQLHS